MGNYGDEGKGNQSEVKESIKEDLKEDWRGGGR